MFDNGHADLVGLGLSEINQVRKTRHHGAANIPGNHHPSIRRRGNPQDLTLKFIDEFPTQTRNSFLVIVTNFLQLPLHVRVIFDGHLRSLAIISSCGN